MLAFKAGAARVISAGKSWQHSGILETVVQSFDEMKTTFEISVRGVLSLYDGTSACALNRENFDAYRWHEMAVTGMYASLDSTAIESEVCPEVEVEFMGIDLARSLNECWYAGLEVTINFAGDPMRPDRWPFLVTGHLDQVATTMSGYDNFTTRVRFKPGRIDHPSRASIDKPNVER